MKRLGLVFPGQGSQHPGMGKRNFDRYAFVGRIYEEASDVLGLDVKKLCLDSSLDVLTRTDIAQVAIFTTSYVAFQVFLLDQVQPLLLAGHSLGELTALTCAEAMSFPEALRLVQARGTIMVRAAKGQEGGMIAVGGIDPTLLERLCSECSQGGLIATVSNDNSPGQIVVSGHRNAINAVGDAVVRHRGRFVPLKVDGAFHGPLMGAAASDFQKALDKQTFRPLRYPVVSNVLAEPYQDASRIADLLVKQLTSPVRWRESMEYFESQRVELVLELGAKGGLKKLVRACSEKMQPLSLDDPEDIEAYQQALGKTGKEEVELLKSIESCIEDAKAAFRLKMGTPVKYSDEGRVAATPVTLCLAAAVCVPNNNPDRKAYDKGVVEPYSNLRKKQALIEKEMRYPHEREVNDGFAMLASVLAAKKVPLTEQLPQFELICRKLRVAASL